MGLPVALLRLAFVAPCFPLLVARLDRHSWVLSTPRRRIIRHASLAGSLGILPAGLLFTLGAYGDWTVLLLIATLGGLYGALVGVCIAWIQSIRYRHRNGER